MALIPFLLLNCSENLPDSNNRSFENTRFVDNGYDEKIYGKLINPDSAITLQGTSLLDSKGRFIFYPDDADTGQFIYLVCTPAMHEIMLSWYVPSLWSIALGDWMYITIEGNFIQHTDGKNPRFFVSFAALSGDQNRVLSYYDPAFEFGETKMNGPTDTTGIHQLNGYLVLTESPEMMLFTRDYSSEYNPNFVYLTAQNDSLKKVTLRAFDDFIYHYHPSKRYSYVSVSGSFQKPLNKEGREEFQFNEIRFTDSVFAAHPYIFAVE